MTNANHILKFLSQLQIKAPLPEDVEVLNPYGDEVVFDLCKKFYHKYYGDDQTRFLILGINPGRHGGGLSGIPFTDGSKLEQNCGIPNSLPKRTELSADFMYAMIKEYGGPEEFYSKFYFSSISPLGFIKDGKNLNYYDVRALQESLKPFITQSLETTLNMKIERSICYCLGEGLNHKYFTALNNEFKWFQSIVPLAHPRFIMQYKRKKMQDYINDYLKKFNQTYNHERTLDS
ncbi:MAG: uracil-DNA glycosylase family protein [Chryseolinea sp.]